MIIIADSPRPHKRILQKGEWRDGGGGRGAAQTALRAVSAAFGRSGGSAAGGCAPISAPFAHPPGGAASSRKPAKKAGQGRGGLSRRGSPAESPGIGPQARRRLRRRRACVPRLRRGGLRPALSRTIPISPHNPTPNCHHVLHTSCTNLSRTNLPPLPSNSTQPAALTRQNPSAPPAKKRRPYRDGALLTFFGFSPAWQGRHGCGRGSPHGPAPPPALCRRRG